MSEKKRILIIGGVAGGASAAARARRLSEDAEIVLFERGEHISFANCGLPYHIGGAIADRDRLLVQTPEAMRRRFRVDVRVRSEVLSIDREARQVRVRNLADGRDYTEGYDVLILSPGAEPVRPKMPGVEHEAVKTLRSLSDMDGILQVIRKRRPQRAVVIGGGYIGLEMAEALVERGMGVSLVELLPQVMAAIDPEMAAPLHQHLRLHGVDLHLNTSVVAVEPAGEDVQVRLNTGEVLDAGLVILSVGVRPEVKLAREAGLEIGERGGIRVDAHMRTTDPSIFAVGDAVEVTDFAGGFATLIPLAGPANRQGRIAADNALGRESTYKKTQGTGICKVFDLAAAMTGMNEKTCQRVGRRYEKVYVHPANHAGYYPGASQISLKLLFDPESGEILGAQAVGAEGVDKRIDVIATAMRVGLKVQQLEELELCYAPPFGSAKDPVNYAGFVAANVMRGDVRLCHVEDLRQAGPGQVLVDVRTPAEVQAGTIPGSVNIPIDQLRERLHELPKDREALVFCAVGLRGYLACRILDQHGYRCRNLTGGYKTWQAVEGISSQAEEPRREMTDDTGEARCEAAPAVSKAAEAAVRIDARGLQCPGPVLRLKEAMDGLSEGQAAAIDSSDPGFAGDIEGWCHATGNRLAGLERVDGHVTATIVKGRPAAACAAAGAGRKQQTIIVFSNDFDKAMASFIIANGAASMGTEVTLFFTFWGLNLLRKDAAVRTQKNVVERMFGWMMPRGASRVKLSKMNMGGMGTAMMQGIMRKKKVLSLPELIEAARRNGVRMVACTMTMDLMGIRPEELIDGVEQGGVAMYLDRAHASNVNLFI